MPAPVLIRLRFTLNGEQVAIQCQPGARLLDLLREEFGLLSVREGCGSGECGSCLVLMDGRAVNSCLVPAFMLADCEIISSEGLLRAYPDLRRLLAGFETAGCGFCDSGLRIALAALLLSDPEPGREELQRALSGNLCGCGQHIAALGRVTGGSRRRHGRR